MGLAFSHGKAHWSYTRFHKFRKQLAKDIGINLEEMIGFGGTKEWESIKSPLKILLDHSDCDGYFTKTEIKKLLPSLRRLRLGEDYTPHDRENLMHLIKGMEEALANSERFYFC